ncbi:type 2 lactosamine alpha-2,3-sialyltransferase-like [Thomomys bottae]
MQPSLWERKQIAEARGQGRRKAGLHSAIRPGIWAFRAAFTEGALRELGPAVHVEDSTIPPLTSLPEPSCPAAPTARKHREASGKRDSRPGMTRCQKILFLTFIVVYYYYILFCIIWGARFYWMSLSELKPNRHFQMCSSPPAFASLLTFPQLYPFLCEDDFKQTASSFDRDQFDLPYGVKKAKSHFETVLSRLEDCELFTEFDNVTCKTCVVVGNGGVLRNKKLRGKIDSYDVIIRMNNGPVLGHEEEVGTRTTFRLFYPESVFSSSSHRDANTIAIFVAFKTYDLNWMLQLLTNHPAYLRHFWKKPPAKLIYKPYQIRLLDPFLIRTTAYELLHFPKVHPRSQRYKYPTMGMIAIALAFHICHEVHIAGFKYNFSDLMSPLHYYGNATMSSMKKNLHHNVTAEQLFLKSIIEKNFVINLTPD